MTQPRPPLHPLALPELRIGPYAIYTIKDLPDHVQIYHREGPSEGEGGGFKKEKFLKAIKEFYDREF